MVLAGHVTSHARNPPVGYDILVVLSLIGCEVRLHTTLNGDVFVVGVVDG